MQTILYKITPGTYRKTQLYGINRLTERPGELMLPQRLHDHLVQVLQLIGAAARLLGIADLWRGWTHLRHVIKDAGIHGWTLKIFV